MATTPLLNGGYTSPFGQPAPQEKQPLSVFQLASNNQQQFFNERQQMLGQPTRFDVQNAQLQIGGAPLPLYRDELGGKHPEEVGFDLTLPYTPQPPATPIYRNPAPFDYGSAVRTSVQPMYTLESESIQRMMRPVDMVDPALVTNPLPDQTFMARQPMFDKSPEDAEMIRRRLQNNGTMRLW